MRVRAEVWAREQEFRNHVRSGGSPWIHLLLVSMNPDMVFAMASDVRRERDP